MDSHDRVTGLANRSTLEEMLDGALAPAQAGRATTAVLLLDLDGFRAVNVSLGHDAGDDLLRQVAGRLAGATEPHDTLARTGADEFAVLLGYLPDADAALEAAERILSSLDSPFSVGGREMRVTGSLGVATADGPETAQELLRQADMAMFDAKEQGGQGITSFEPGMHRRAIDRFELGAELPRAIAREEFVLEYQPIVELDGRRIAAVEALVRWDHPRRGRLAPGHFIELAEGTGDIVGLGLWVLRTACEQMAEWHRALPGSRTPHVSVNVSIRQLLDARFAADVEAVLAATGLEPRSLVLEMTESLLADDRELLRRRLEALRSLGVRLAVDDFGTGYSAFGNLQRLPLDFLKLDRSFVEGIVRDDARANLVRGIVGLCESLSLDVIAEGIEEPEQADRLLGMRSRLGQGYLFSRPIGAAAMAALLGRPGGPASGA
jgi:diguanylate cyclase (GGDEF)-like protein